MLSQALHVKADSHQGCCFATAYGSGVFPDQNEVKMNGM